MIEHSPLRDRIAEVLADRYFGRLGSGSTNPNYTPHTWLPPQCGFLADALLPLIEAELAAVAEQRDMHQQERLWAHNREADQAEEIEELKAEIVRQDRMLTMALLDKKALYERAEKAEQALAAAYEQRDEAWGDLANVAAERNAAVEALAAARRDAWYQGWQAGWTDCNADDDDQVTTNPYAQRADTAEPDTDSEEGQR